MSLEDCITLWIEKVWKNRIVFFDHQAFFKDSARLHRSKYRSICFEVFCKWKCSYICAKLIGNTCAGDFFNKATGLQQLYYHTCDFINCRNCSNFRNWCKLMWIWGNHFTESDQSLYIDVITMNHYIPWKK